MHRNGKLMAMTRYTYDDAGRVTTAVSEQPDGSIVRRLYRYDEQGNVIVFIETHPRDSARDKTEITTYEYDQRGNWTRRISSEPSIRSTKKAFRSKNRFKSPSGKLSTAISLCSDLRKKFSLSEYGA